MTDDELLTLAHGCLSKWQPRLHLADWIITVLIAGDVDADRGAEVDVDWRHRRAVIRLPPDTCDRMRRSSDVWLSASDAEIVEWGVLHECLHVAEEPLAEQFRVDLHEWIGADSTAGSETRRRFRDYREWWVNQAVRSLLEADRGAWSGG